MGITSVQGGGFSPKETHLPGQYLASCHHFEGYHAAAALSMLSAPGFSSPVPLYAQRFPRTLIVEIKIPRLSGIPLECEDKHGPGEGVHRYLS